MPLYELTLIVKAMAKTETVSVVKRCCTSLLQSGCVIEKLDSLGCRDLPFRMTKEGQKHMAGNYFLLRCWLPIEKYSEMRQEFKQDTDVVRHTFIRQPIPGSKEFETANSPVQCSLEEELLPPPMRKTVVALRQNQRMAWLTRLAVAAKAREAHRAKPKSYYVREPKE